MSDEKASAIVERYGTDESATLSALQDLQEENGYLPREALMVVSQKMEVPLSRVLSLATFFNAFSLKPKGKHHINVCMGTACHVRGSQLILEKLERELGVKTGDTTADRNFSLDAEGTLVTQEGFRVMGGGGPVIISGSETYVYGQGVIKVDGSDVGQIDVVAFEKPEALIK